MVLKYFKIAKELNEKYHLLLTQYKLHFRGNQKSFSLVSLEKDTAEKGKSRLKSKEPAEKLLLSNNLKLETPKRSTPEKELQAWIINFAVNNDGILPFGKKIQFITSELAIHIDINEYYGELGLFYPKKKMVNDILAIDEKSNLCIIELKTKRVNEVKKQAIDFEKVILKNKDFFKELIFLMTSKTWNGKCRKISVWNKVKGKIKPREYFEVEEINYSKIEGTDDYKFEESK